MRYFSDLQFNNKDFIKSLILGIISSVAMIIILLCITTIMLKSASLLPYEYLSYLMLAIDGIAVLFGGYVAGRINKSQGLILGLSNGFIIFVALLIAGFCISSEVSIITLIKAIVIILFSVIGAVKGVNTKEKLHIK